MVAESYPVAPAAVDKLPVAEPPLAPVATGTSTPAVADQAGPPSTETCESGQTGELAQPGALAQAAPAAVGPPPPVGGPPLVPLLEDGPLLAFHKPAGLLTVGAIPHIPTLERQVK
ncbi:MAG: hypothetical protein ACKOJF_00365, partial [Planctomycetaceae bacterium]